MGKILYIIILLFVGFGTTQAQVSSAAFDPNCYFPRIGVPLEIDTIYGAHRDQYLGDGMLNIGPTPGDSYGRMICTFDHNDFNNTWKDSIFTTGTTFNLQHPNVLGNWGKIPITRRGHFQSAKYSDILSWDPGFWGDQAGARIYWQDDQANFDTSRYTELTSHIKGKLATDYSFMEPYSSHIFSDTVEDIIYSVLLNNTNTKQDSMYILYFKGGTKLFDSPKYTIEDSSIFFDKLATAQKAIGGTNEGDYRGVGRADLLISDYDSNFFFYRNDSPFSMSSFIYALKYDTLFAQWENPNSINIRGGGPAMQVFHKLPGDSSIDFLPFFLTRYGSKYIHEYRIFKGGKDFGSQRWTADSASFVLHEPYYYDSRSQYSWGLNVRDCGDMTGTGNHVLYASGLNGLYGFSYFYVLGSALDDKVDMYIDAPTSGYGGGAGSNVDSLTADDDIYKDILMGASGYGKDNAEGTGSIYLVHGSKKIPVHTNGVFPRKSVDESPSHILAYPNPCDEHTVLTFDNCAASKMQIRIISSNGVEVRHEETPAVDGLQQYAVDLSSLAAGDYIINLSCPIPGWSSSINVIKTGAAVTPWSFDLKKMVGR